MKRAILIIGICTIAFSAGNTISLKLLGEGPYLSVEYERNFFQKELWSQKMELSAHAGLGMNMLGFRDELSLPLGGRIYWGGPKHRAFLGLGLSLYHLKQYDYYDDENTRELRVLLIPALGYRFGREGINASLQLSPVINPGNTPAVIWLGISIGWGF